MLFDLSGKHGVRPNLSHLPQHENEPVPPESEEVAIRIDEDCLRACAEAEPEKTSGFGTGSSSVGCNSIAMSDTRSCGLDIGGRLAAARRKAFVRQLQLRVPPLFFGATSLVGNLAVAKLGPKFSLSHIVSSLFLAMALCVGFFGLLPSDKRAVPLSCIFIFLPLLCLNAALNLLDAIGHWQKLRDRNCSVGDEVLQCWFVGWLSAEYLGYTIASCAIALRGGIALKARLPSRNLLSIFGSCVGWIMIIFGVPSFLGAIAAVVAGASISLAIRIFATGLGYLTFGPMMLARDGVRYRIESWFASRSESVFMAAGVAELLGGASIDDLLTVARSSFRFVKANRLSFKDMANNSPDPTLGALTEKGRLGFVDAFVSHSWHDDPMQKWDALQEIIEEFKATHKRIPRLWIDKFSVDQNNIESSLASLPVYLSGCRQLWVLCGSTYLQRLWCIVEIFVFLEMGGLRSNLHVKLLSPRCAVAMQKSESLAMQISQFDPRNARCFTESDTERLHAVIRVTGYSKISELVRDVFDNC